MPRTKTNVSKLPKALRTPIDVGYPHLGLQGKELDAWFAEMHLKTFIGQAQKVDLLMEQFKIPADAEMRWVLLSIALARKLYRGFLTTIEAKPIGRARRGQKMEKISEHAATAFSTGEVYMPVGGGFDPVDVLKIIDALRESGAAKTDQDACKILLTTRNEKLSSSARRTELAKKAASMAAIIATTRASAKRKADGKLN